MAIRLRIANPEYLPVQAVLNAGNEQEFYRHVQAILKREGFGDNGVQCDFSENREPNDEAWKGVRCTLFEETVHISEEEFLQLLLQAIEFHQIESPEYADSLRGLVNDYRQNFLSRVKVIGHT